MCELDCLPQASRFCGCTTVENGVKIIAWIMVILAIILTLVLALLAAGMFLLTENELIRTVTIIVIVLICTIVYVIACIVFVGVYKKNTALLLITAWINWIAAIFSFLAIIQFLAIPDYALAVWFLINGVLELYFGFILHSYAVELRYKFEEEEDAYPTSQVRGPRGPTYRGGGPPAPPMGQGRYQWGPQAQYPTQPQYPPEPAQYPDEEDPLRKKKKRKKRRLEDPEENYVACQYTYPVREPLDELGQGGPTANVKEPESFTQTSHVSLKDVGAGESLQTPRENMFCLKGDALIEGGSPTTEAGIPGNPLPPLDVEALILTPQDPLTKPSPHIV